MLETAVSANWTTPPCPHHAAPVLALAQPTTPQPTSVTPGQAEPFLTTAWLAPSHLTVACPRRDSNPQPLRPQRSASADWATWTGALGFVVPGPYTYAVSDERLESCVLLQRVRFRCINIGCASCCVAVDVWIQTPVRPSDRKLTGLVSPMDWISALGGRRVYQFPHPVMRDRSRTRTCNRTSL